MADKETRGPDEPLIETLPDGRHRTNLDLLIRTAEAQQHFKEISEFFSGLGNPKSPREPKGILLHQSQVFMQMWPSFCKGK